MNDGEVNDERGYEGPIAALWLMTVCSACGPGVAGEGDGDGGSAGTTPSATDTASVGCTSSDLPAPFCHRRFDLPIEFWNLAFLPGSTIRWGSIAFVSRESAGATRFELGLFDTESMMVGPTVDVDELLANGRLLYGDFDGDGEMDVAINPDREMIPAFGGPGLVSLGAIPARTPDGVPKTNVPAAIFDINRDGKDEIITPTGNTPTQEVWSWNGAWTLIGEITSGPCFWRQVGHGDLDGDGNVELLIYPNESCGGAADPYDPSVDIVQVFRSSHGATTTEPLQYPLGIRAYNLAVGDYDGDGQDDVMVLDDWTRIALMRSNADGSLPDPTIHSHA